MIQIGNKLKELRINQGLKEHDIAKKLNVAVSTISSYENNFRKPSLENILVLADIYGVSVDYLLSRPNNNMISVDGLNKEQILVVKNLIQCLKRS